MTKKAETAGSSASSTGKIARSAGAVSIAVMCSRVLGLVREQVFAGLFGAGYAYDAFVVAFRIPNLLRDLFGEGALSAAFVTVFSDYETNKGTEHTWQLASNVLVFIAIVLSSITLLGMFFAEPLVMLLAPDFDAVAGKTALTVWLTRIMFPFLIFVALAAVVMGMLNTKGKFFVPAISSSFFNLGSLIGGTSLAFLLPQFGLPGIVGMAWGTLIGGLLQLTIQLPTLWKTGFRFQPQLNLRDPGLRRILWLMLPATIGLSATQINIFVNTNFAASCMEGSVSWLNYAFRMVQLPIGVFGVAFSIAAMPVLARHAAEKDLNGLRKTFASSLVMVFSLTIPATVGLILLAQPIIRLIFEHGAFTATDTLRTAQALTCYAYGLFAYSAVKIMVPVFYALKDTKYPVIASFLAVVANIIFITLTIDIFSFRTIALSTSCSMGLNFLFLGTVLYRKLTGFSLYYLGLGVFKILLASTAMGLAVMGLQRMLAPLLSKGIFSQLIGVFSIIAVAALLYGMVLHLLQLPEFDEVTDKMRQRLGR
ncbi:MAG: murein biosynthesis integral membrane protein MurJ [Candidatus Electrothrix sp. AW1]|nr:murein biosynthesis integral membrane protein MurJ [Candidatus Electrothrix sp. AX1]MCI5182111.1 murein biosynthesis integral membrane protein MurJ [Candidatus Electrothrix gigas]